jgi:hypothetical protein
VARPHLPSALDNPTGLCSATPRPFYDGKSVAETLVLPFDKDDDMNFDLNTFKQGAKRLRAHLSAAEHTPASQIAPTHGESLDLLAKVHGFRDFHEARMRLELGESRVLPSGALAGVDASSPCVLAIVGPPGCGKTTEAKAIIISALAEGLPVRVLGFDDYKFCQLLGGLAVDDIEDPGFYSAWCSEAPLVFGMVDSREKARALDFAKMSLPANALFVCDEPFLFGDRVRALGATTVLVAQTLDGVPLKPAVCLKKIPGEPGWQITLPDGQGPTFFSKLLLRR